MAWRSGTGPLPSTPLLEGWGSSSPRAECRLGSGRVVWQMPRSMPANEQVAATNGAGHLRSLRALVESVVVATDSGWRMLDPAALGFSLEQGPRPLGASFASVEVVRPSDVGRVVVSDTTVITDYLTSVADAYGRQVGRPWREVVDAVRTELLAVATRDAHPIEVTPPVSPGEDWTEQRVEWLRSLHRDRRGGLSPAATEACWAVRAEGVIVGAARLQRTSREGCVEAGVWFCRSARQNDNGRHTLVTSWTLPPRAAPDRSAPRPQKATMLPLQSWGGSASTTSRWAGRPSAPRGRAGGPSIRAHRALPPPSHEAHP